MDDPPGPTLDYASPPSLKGKNPLTKLRLKGNIMENNLFATNELSEKDPKVIKDSIESEIENYKTNQEMYEEYKSSLVDNILMLVRLLAGNDEFSDSGKLLTYKQEIMKKHEYVFGKNSEFKRFITEVFDFYSNPDNLGTGENTREGIFSLFDYKIEGGSKARKTKLKKRRLCKRKTRKHRK
jgi:hypothetical protein